MCNREQDLKEWQDVENLFAELLLERNPGSVIEQPLGCFKDYDLKLTKDNNEVISFEVKYDRKCDVTGNVAIEKLYDWRESGIFRSTADFIIYFLGGDFRCIKREELKTKVLWYKEVTWWDWLKSELYLVPKQDFISRCIKVWQ